MSALALDSLPATALRFEDLQAPMAMFAEAMFGEFIRIDKAAQPETDSGSASAPGSGDNAGRGARGRASQARPGMHGDAPQARLILQPVYDAFPQRRQNLGACHIDILRQVIALQARRADPSVPADQRTGEGFPGRIFRALQAIRRDARLARDYPGVRGDLAAALQLAAQSQATALESATALQTDILQRIEAMAVGASQHPAAEESPAELLSDALNQALRLAALCARPGTRLRACLSRTLRICVLAGHALPGWLDAALEMQWVELAALGLDEPGDELPAREPASQADDSGTDDPQGTEAAPEEALASTRSGELARKPGQAGAGAQVPDYFELLTGNDEGEGIALSDAATRQAMLRRPASAARRSLLYPEWSFLERQYLPAWCRVHEHRLRGDDTRFIRGVRQRHAALAREVRQRLAAIRPKQLQRVTRHIDGDEPDLDAVINMLAERRAGRHVDERLYIKRQRATREVSAAFLVDMSGSTNISMPSRAASSGHPGSGSSAVPAAATTLLEDYLYGGGMSAASEPQPPMRRVIDVAKDALALMCDGLHGLGDHFAVYGFSGDGREQVDFYIAKEFDEALSGRTWAALSAIEPKRSGRLGPAIRHAVHKFRAQAGVQRLLIIVSDGYPQDSDYGPDPDLIEYGIQDSAKAIAEAESAGIKTFFITIDPAGQDYMGRICDERRSMLIDDIGELPLALSKVYGGLRGG